MHNTLCSHLCIFPKEPVLVTTLHSQQGIFVLLFQLHDLLLQGGVCAFRAPGGDTWRQLIWSSCFWSIFFLYSCVWFCKLRKEENLQKKKKKKRLYVHPFQREEFKQGPWQLQGSSKAASRQLQGSFKASSRQHNCNSTFVNGQRVVSLPVS